MHPDPDSSPSRWRVIPALPILKLGGTALFLGLGALFADGDPARLGAAVLVAVALLGWGLRDLVAPVRLAADADGVTVIRGFARHRHIPWAELERITVDTRPHLGLRTETLEIDSGTSLHLFSRHDLGAAPAEVAAALRRERSTRCTGPSSDGPTH